MAEPGQKDHGCQHTDHTDPDHILLANFSNNAFDQYSLGDDGDETDISEDQSNFTGHCLEIITREEYPFSIESKCSGDG